MAETLKFINDPINITQLALSNEDPDDDSYAMPYDDLVEVLNKSCVTLNHPVTVLNVNYPIETESHFTSIRVDSAASFFSLSLPCRNLRIAAKPNVCYVVDHYYAQLLKALVENRKCVESPPPCIENEKFLFPQLNNRHGIPYLMYRCEMLGCWELCFGILFHKNIIGVLFVGNTNIESTSVTTDFDTRSEKEIRDSFLKKQKKEKDCGFFRDYIEKAPEDFNNIDRIIDIFSINAESNILLPSAENNNLLPDDFRKALNSVEFDEYIEKCCSVVKNVEKEIENAWETRQKNYISKNIDFALQEFNLCYERLRSTDTISYNDLQDLYRSIWTFVIQIKQKYNLFYCRLFDNLPFISGSDFVETLFNERQLDNYKNDIGICPYEMTVSSYPFDDSKMQVPDFSTIKKDFSCADLNSYECLSSLDSESKQAALSCFSVNGTNLQGEKEVVLACSNLAVIFGTSNNPSLDRNLVILFGEVSKVFALICSKVQELSTSFLKRKYSETLSLYKHECTHYAQRIMRSNHYYKNRERFERLPEEKQESIYRDIHSVATFLEVLSENIQLVLQDSTSKSIIEHEPFDLNEAINQWNAMYRLELRLESKKIVKSTSRFDMHRLLYTNKSLFSNLLLNIIDNAIKYSYPGTIIDISLQEDKTNYQLAISNYGACIENNAKPYDLFYRSSNLSSQFIGDGIGLFSSKKICDILQLKINHKCELISEINFPLAQVGRSKKYDIPPELTGKILEGENQYCDILEPIVYYNNMSKEEFNAKLKLPMYKVTFFISNIEEYRR